MLIITYLTPRESQDTHAEDLGDGDAADDAACDVDHGGPGAGVTTAEAVSRGLLHGSAAGEGECTGDVRCELDADTDADDEVDERNGVEGYAEDSHGADDRRDCHADYEGDDETCG